MTAFYKGRAVQRVDEILIDGKKYTEAELKQMIKDRK